MTGFTSAPDDGLCVNCGFEPWRRKKRCDACYLYLRRHGRERPIGYAILHERRKDERRFLRAAGWDV